MSTANLGRDGNWLWKGLTLLLLIHWIGWMAIWPKPRTIPPSNESAVKLPMSRPAEVKEEKKDERGPMDAAVLRNLRGEY